MSTNPELLRIGWELVTVMEREIARFKAILMTEIAVTPGPGQLLTEEGVEEVPSDTYQVKAPNIIFSEVPGGRTKVTYMVDMNQAVSTVPDAPQATNQAPAGVDYRLEPIGWQTGLKVDPAGVVHQGVFNKQDFVRIYCPFGCGGSDVYDKAVFTLRKVIKCRRCKRSFEVKRMDDVHLWKAIDNEEPKA